jgi:hypothetical protein
MFSRKLARAKMPAFQISDPPLEQPVSVVVQDAASAQTIGRVLTGALFASLTASVLLAWMTVSKADVVAYVADGGVFGCKVPVKEAAVQ